MIPQIPVTFHLTFLLLPAILVVLAVALARWEGRRRTRVDAPEPSAKAPREAP